MQVIVLSHLLAALLLLSGYDARSTRVSAQYTVSDGNSEPKRTFGTRGIVEDAVIEDGGILTKLNTRPSRNSPRGQKRRPPTINPSPDYEQISFQPEFFAVKGQVLDDIEPIPTKSKLNTRPTRGKTYTKHTIPHSSPTKSIQHHISTKNPFRFPSIQNEDVFNSKLQEAPSAVNIKKYKSPEANDDSVFTYSTLKFDADDASDDSFFGKARNKAPKRSTAPVNPAQFFNLEQNFGGQQTKFDKNIENDDDDFNFQPSTKFTSPLKTQKPPKLFKSTEDDFKDSDFYDFSIRSRPGQIGNPVNGQNIKFEKFKSDLGVKSLAIKGHNNKFDPHAHPQIEGGFKPSFKLRDFPSIHGSEIGSGIASPGQIKTFFEAAEFEHDQKLKQKFANDQHPASKAQLQQFLRAKEDERLEKLVEEQFKLQQQKQIAQEKEVELKLQQQVLQRQKEKLKQVEKHLSDKVTRQSTRQKRRPNGQVSSRRQRNPNPINFSVSSNGQSAIPLRTVSSKDGAYRVKFNVQ